MEHPTDIFSGQRWRADALGQFERAYPAQPAVFGHGLSGHPLLDRTALAEAAARLPLTSIEVRGRGFAAIPAARDDIGAILSGNATGPVWLMLRGLETLAAYRELIDEILAPVADIARGRTGRLHQPRAFLFCANAEAVTPHHIDPEHNILFHLEGPKRFSLRPDAEPFLSAQDHFRLHRCGDNLLDPADEAGFTTHSLEPGTALYVPYKWPHRVAVGDAPSLSLSITWTSDWSLARDAAWRGEALLHDLGWPHMPMPDYPAKTPLRTAIGRIAGLFQ